MSIKEYAQIPTRAAMQALVAEWHDANEAGCCDSDEPPYCAESKAYAQGYLAALASLGSAEYEHWDGTIKPFDFDRLHVT